MSQPVPVFVDERPVAAPAGASVATVVAGADAGLAAALRDGRAYVTDGVGRPLDPGTPVFAGAILRVVRSARRPSAE